MSDKCVSPQTWSLTKPPTSSLFIHLSLVLTQPTRNIPVSTLECDFRHPAASMVVQETCTASHNKYIITFWVRLLPLRIINSEEVKSTFQYVKSNKNEHLLGIYNSKPQKVFWEISYLSYHLAVLTTSLQFLNYNLYFVNQIPQEGKVTPHPKSQS